MISLGDYKYGCILRDHWLKVPDLRPDRVWAEVWNPIISYTGRPRSIL